MAAHLRGSVCSAFRVPVWATIQPSLPVHTASSTVLLHRLPRSSSANMSTTTTTTTTTSSSSSTSPPSETATFAAGCFWGVEQEFRKHFPQALRDARVGYIGGDAQNPSYRLVCSGQTGHAEAVRLTFDPARASYAQLVAFFYRMHDPTTTNQQGNDRGTQYRSGIFFHDAAQAAAARRVTDLANAQWWHGRIVTQLLPAGEWWDAEDYHQRYLDKNPGGYVCASHHVRPFAKLEGVE